MENGIKISDQYAACLGDTRARFHFGPKIVLTLQVPQRALAEAFIEHLGAGELSTYRHLQRTERGFSTTSPFMSMSSRMCSSGCGPT